MAKIKVLGRVIDVDVRAEVEEYEWNNARWSEDKLIASSPFRDDSAPSFFVAFDGEYAGVFNDSGYDDPYYKDGGLAKLLAFLRDETFEEAAQYLIEKYDAEYAEDVIPLIKPNKIRGKSVFVAVNPALYRKRLDETYLIGRGIHPRIIEMNGIFDDGNAIGIPWRGLNGDVNAVKYRSKKDKTFWYADNATPLARLVFGLNHVIERGVERIAICEAEIDAMTWQSAGIMAVAIGGARMNEYQADAIIGSGVKSVILAGDNDDAGRKFNRRVEGLLKGRVEIERLDYTQFGRNKDVNELGAARLRNLRTTVNKQCIRL